MASGYGPEMDNDSGRISSTIRYYYSTSYDAATNTSTVTLTPQLYADVLWGSDIRMYSGGASNAGIRVDQSTLWSFTDGYGGTRHLYCTGNDWNSMYANTGATFSFSKTHDNSGNLSFSAGIVGTISGYGAEVSVYDWPTGRTISIHENRSLYVSYNANGGSGAPSATYFYGSTENIVLSSTKPTRDGYTFLGWSISSTASNATYSSGQNIGKRSSNLILYAVWKINTWTISYNANGGENAPNSQTKIYNQTLVLSNSIPIYTGRDFLGWSTDPEATSAMYQAGGNYTKNEAAILYAVWGAKQYMLSIITSQNGVTSQISRVSSPLGNGSIGEITNGATLYYNDVLSINYTIGGVYQLISATVNNIDISDNVPYSLTVNSNVVVNISVKLDAIVYIGNEAYQAFIGTLINGNVIWQQYQAFIGNGSTYDQY